MSKMSEQEKKEYKLASRAASAIEENKTHGPVDGNYGICSKCVYFVYREYEFGHRSFAACSHHHFDRDFILHSSLRITRCNDFAQRGVPSLETMWLLAKHIEVKKDRVVGFATSQADEDELYLLEEGLDD